MTTRLLLLAVLPFFVLACGDDGTGPEGATTPVTVTFAASGGAALASPASVAGRAPSAQSPLVVEGTNGTLEIDAVHLVVAELELEGSEGACESSEEMDDDADEDDDGDDDEEDSECPDFEADPFFLDLPLDGSGVEVVTDEVAAGTYHELEFEAEDVELDEEDEDEAELTALADEIRADFPEWPAEASLRVAGTFTPADGDPVEYATYFDAEVEVEMILDPPLEITGDGASRELVVRVRPDLWFERMDGTVRDLSALQDAEELPELEVELEDGFFEVEVEGED